ncbi:MAG TPA: radical SAM protein [Terriglobia bacterium]|nr:radical SAM protein [Terriglobia bacterium]
MVDSVQIEPSTAVTPPTHPGLEIRELPVLVLLPHNRCNCRCLMCDIWKIREAREITQKDLEPHLDSLRQLRVQWLVLSGGEPLLHSSLPSLCHAVRGLGIRITLLTSGLLLGSRAPMIAENFDDIIVSLDGPADIHNRIRGIPKAFQKMDDGIKTLRALRPDLSIQGRCTVQRENCRSLLDTVSAAGELKLDSISFLAVDITSQAFNRPEAWSSNRQATMRLTSGDIEDMEQEIERLVVEIGQEIPDGFVVETPEKLRRIPRHFRALLRQIQPESPRCNAPWVSAVIDSDGFVQPCFFHPALGNIREQPLISILNGRKAMQFRQRLDIPNDPICQRCVCSLFIPPAEKGQD